MAWVDVIVKSLLYGPILAFLIIIFIPAAFGKTIGFRQFYVNVLIYLFEYGKRRIDRAHELKTLDPFEETRWSSSESDDEIEHDDEKKLERDQKAPPYVTEKRLGRTYSIAPEVPSSILRTTKRRLSLSDLSESHPHSGTRSGDSISEEPADFLLSDIFEFVTSGEEAIVNDQVTQRFVTEQLKSWNLLTRTNKSYEFISFRLSCLWLIGCIFRYWILLPIRLFIFVISMITLVVTTAFIGLVPNRWSGKKKLHDSITRFAYRLFSRCFSLIATYHQTENKPKGGGICVANHTSVIDIVSLGCETSFALIGQSHGGFLGFLQFILGRAADHIFFERSEAKDRMAVTRRLKEHVEDSNKLPILIFPEGTCINNSAVMQFKKGSFEVGGIVYPVAIKYDPRFGEAFWNSSEQSMLQYLYMMMTSWAIVCDVWYLPPMLRLPGEPSIDFANRVKAEIARQGGLVDLDWDGQLKRNPAKREWKEKEQLKYSQKLTQSAPKKI